MTATMTSPISVLVADDMSDHQELLARTLAERGYRCATASNGDEVRALLRENTFDLLITDVRMPGNEDLELLESLAEIAPGMPAILVSGFPSFEIVSRALGLPVAGYLSKPFDSDELFALVDKSMKTRNMSRTMLDARDRMRDSMAEIDDLVQIAADASSPFSITADQFMEISLRNITRSVQEMHRMIGLSSIDKTGASVCQLSSCPRPLALLQTIEEAVVVLEKTKKSFHSKALAELRRTLESVTHECRQTMN